ncbi:SDR family NAD(P)-dependent oxidoreductase [Blastomonas sp.]|jgi:NAD(P)-dependent dehydrogenase (short-subunit alcohol dehydrogenase family)|uniref:SDR family NAD(P)-dependent oxidoreductase n=1 Tax=Blastomonas TaxID=150203 RepID=UPI00258F7720|nr:SDR family oxidoreductase [Blastomonas sp.]MCO5791699.1 SDR family oxidoreductase [Blastomonas sp.]
MTFDIRNKVVLITGAASGIGAATARLAAERGAHVIATDLDGARMQGVAADCHCIGLTHDVTSQDDWDNAIAAAVHHYGRLDALVSNAGIVNYERIIDLDMARFRRLNQVHVEGSFIGLQKAVAQMRAQSGGKPATGSIVLTASVMANCAAPAISAYAAAKAAMANMARAVGVEVGRKGDMIRVNAVCPGPTRTPLLEGVMPAGAMNDPAHWADVPLGVPQEPEDIAESILFLISEESSFMTATQMVVDGGWSLT